MAVRTTSTFQAGADKHQVSSYAPAGAPPKAPAVVLLHGTDGLEGESGTEIPKLAAQIADAGFIVFVPEYFGKNEPAGLPLEDLYMRRIPHPVGGHLKHLAWLGRSNTPGRTHALIAIAWG
jgi:dienelactone hydrolase